MTKCEECLDTGWVGNNVSGKSDNNGYMPCDCANGKAIKASIRNRPAYEIPTDDIIAELERRRPTDCMKCKKRGPNNCEECYWDVAPSGNKDNFREEV